MYIRNETCVIEEEEEEDQLNKSETCLKRNVPLNLFFLDIAVLQPGRR